MRGIRPGLIMIFALSVFLSGAVRGEDPKPGGRLDYTMPPKKFKTWIESEVKIYRQKLDARNPKPPKGIALILQSFGGASVTSGERNIKEGEFILDGDSFKTSDTQSLRIGYRTGDQILVAPRTELKFHDVSPEDGISNPVLDVLSGEVRVLVKAAENRVAAPSSRVFVFVARTPEGVFAATGTDYVVFSKPDFVSVHTLTGTVKYSRDFASLREREGQDIPGGYFASLRPPDRKLGASKRIDIGAYVKAFERRLPDMRRLWIAGDQDAKHGKARMKFLKAEELLSKPHVPSAFVRPKKSARPKK